MRKSENIIQIRKHYKSVRTETRLINTGKEREYVIIQANEKCKRSEKIIHANDQYRRMKHSPGP